MSAPTTYPLPDGIVGLKGPVRKVAPGTLPLRGDLAHIALAERYLAAHYVVPIARAIGDAAVTLKLANRDDAAEGETLAASEAVELLDLAGDWAWITRGPDGPSGYVRRAALAPVDAA